MAARMGLPSRNNMKKDRVIFWLVMLGSAVLFFAPIGAEEHTGLGLDKLVHVALFAMLGDFAFLAFRAKRLKISLALLSYAIIVELIQTWFIPHRTGDWKDVAAGAAGIILINLSRRIERRESSD